MSRDSGRKATGNQTEILKGLITLVELTQNAQQGKNRTKQHRQNRRPTATDVTRFNATTTEQITVSLGESGNGVCFTGGQMTVQQAQALKNDLNTMVGNILQTVGVPANQVTPHKVDQVLSPTSNNKPQKIGLTTPNAILRSTKLANGSAIGLFGRTLAKQILRRATNWPDTTLPRQNTLVGIVMREVRNSKLFTKQAMLTLGFDTVAIYSAQTQTEQTAPQTPQQIQDTTSNPGTYSWNTTTATTTQTPSNGREPVTTRG